MSEHGELIDWLLENWIARLADSLEGMTGERPGGVWRAVEGVRCGDGEALWWEQPLSLGENATFWAGAPQAAWFEIGSRALRGAGVEVADTRDARNTYLEVLSQACSGMARVIGRRVGTEVTCGKGHETPPPAKGVPGFDIEMTLGGAALPPLHLCLTPALRDAIQAGVARAGPKAVAAPGTLDLLLEVELPVSVSFGRAQLPLKDVLKLTAGSIVELNRTVSEPVEVIVNDCVIARGEVVVVDGNYGVRIQEITSREKRLKTLQ